MTKLWELGYWKVKKVLWYSSTYGMSSHVTTSSSYMGSSSSGSSASSSSHTSSTTSNICTFLFVLLFCYFSDLLFLLDQCYFINDKSCFSFTSCEALLFHNSSSMIDIRCIDESFRDGFFVVLFTQLFDDILSPSKFFLERSFQRLSHILNGILLCLYFNIWLV
jgi:hypothetical protein